MSEDLTTPLLEQQLPQQFIYDLGLYLQTCAHIEVSACSLLAEIECRLECSRKKNEKFHELRKMKIGELAALLARKSSHLEGDWGELVKEISEWVERYKQNRHIAAHGAFFVAKPQQTLRVLYTHKYRDHGQIFYQSEEAEISRTLVLELIADADRLLRHLARVAIGVEIGEIAVSL